MTFHHAKLDVSIAGVKARRVMAQLPTLELFYKIVVRLPSSPIKSDVSSDVPVTGIEARCF
jgi:hypothetical protein